MQNAADHTTVVHPVLAANIRRQKGRDPLPLLVAQPKQVASHAPGSYPRRREITIRFSPQAI
jgi:hypothetical protein